MEVCSPYCTELGPTTLDEIEKNLFLGGQAAARNSELLTRHKITHVLTIDLRPLPLSIVTKHNLITKYLQLLDLPSEDLLSHLDDTYSFIEKGQEIGAVLVHCYFGVSRSASVVIGFLMKKYRLAYEKAFQMVRDKRSIIFPNEGFVSQLKVYRSMGYQVNIGSIQHKMHCLTIAAESVRKLKILPKEFYKIIQSNPISDKLPSNLTVYKCRKCKKLLATENNILPHKCEDKVCEKGYFLEPMHWMNVSRVDRGRLCCPKCSVDIGTFNWVVGCVCPCGIHIRPAFFLNSNRVEFAKNVSDKNKS